MMLRHILFLWEYGAFRDSQSTLLKLLYQPCNHVMKIMTLYDYDVETYHSCGAFKDPSSTSLYCVTMVIMV